MPQQSESPRTVASQDIAADLRRRIQSGEFVAGMRLPSEASLAEEYRVTRSLVRGAMAKLARQSLVLARPRDGWMVQARHHTQVFDRMLSFAQWAEAGGRVAGGLISARVWRGADAREAQQLGVRPGERILCFTRVRTLDGLVVMVERSAWAPWVADVVDAMPNDVASTTAALALEGIRVTSGSHRIEAVAASTQDAALLGVRRSSPLLQVSRTTATREGRVVELGVDRYLAGTIAFDVNAGESTRAVV
ncbi:GntR family transcriptional regulator [Leifsonia sp. NCR5]|uniref:GntR family transcriptional regulator n=1 Tax=Leifsonia sp. NCR5 TaxID=1978342 RepID=UPI000A193E4D|nr:GntR family transcriptional regulator [Leifsonia sp. NCR5]